MEFVVSMLRTLFFTLDTIVFGLIDDIYELLIQISRTTIFDQDALHSFSQRVYVMLGLFMLLKVMISIVNYILNPDDLVDKEKGFANIIKRIILSLVMIVLVPYVFAEAYELQGIILKENTIMTIIFGSPGEDYRKQNNTSKANANVYDTAGQKIQFTVMYAFAQPNYEEMTAGDFDLSDCKSTYEIDDDNNYVFRERATLDSSKKTKSAYIYKLNESCFGVYDVDKDMYKSTNSSNGHLLLLFDQITKTDDKKDKYQDEIYQNYAQGVAQQSFSLMFRKNIILAKDTNGIYAINYKWGVSTAVGVAVVYMLLIFCVDIAGRSIKLGFLQLISPIPILSYCDPKSSKDGMFKKWYTMCFKAYAELFIKLFALYFGIYIISLVGTFKDVITLEAIDNWLVSIFMIIGVLIFIKKLPEIIKDALGVDLGGKLELNPLKKLENEAFGAKAITGAAAGAVTGAVGGLTGANGRGIHRLTGFGKGALLGGLSGGIGNKGLEETLKKQREKNRTMRSAILDGSTFGGRMGARISNAIGAPTRSESLETQAHRIDEQIKDIDNRLKPTKDSIADRKSYTGKVKELEDRAINRIKNGEAGILSQNYKTLLNNAENIREQMRQGLATAQQVAQAEMAADDYLNNYARNDYINNEIGAATGARAYNDGHGNVVAGDASYTRTNDAALTGMYNDLRAMVTNEHTYTHDGGTVTVNAAAIADAATMHGNAGQVNGSITYDTRNTINPAEGEKQALEQEKADIYTRQRRAKANENAIK